MYVTPCKAGSPAQLSFVLSSLAGVQEEERKRHLLRMWITPEQGWPLPEQFADRYHTVEIGNRGGIYCPNESPYVPLDPYQ